MMRQHSLHARSTLATTGKKFYMYDGPQFKWRDLLTCYRHENGRAAPWEVGLGQTWNQQAQTQTSCAMGGIFAFSGAHTGRLCAACNSYIVFTFSSLTAQESSKVKSS
jgi:hypothetical protein